MKKFTRAYLVTLTLFAFTLTTMAIAVDLAVHPNGEEDFYKGAYAVYVDYTLNEDLIKDLPEPIKVPVDYKAPGFDTSRLSPPQAARIYPRIINGSDGNFTITIGDHINIL